MKAYTGGHVNPSVCILPMILVNRFSLNLVLESSTLKVV